MPDEKWVPPSDEDIERALLTLPGQVKEQGLQCVCLEEEWDKLEAAHDLKMAKSLITNKTKNSDLTGPILKAMSIIESHDERISCITAKANFKRAEVTHTYLDNRFTSVKKEIEFKKISFIRANN